jgi:uncharacterized membrane protein
LDTRASRPARLAVAIAITALLSIVSIPIASADGGLEVATPYPAVAVAPGDKVSFDLTVSSVRVADIALSIDGVPTGWTASLIGGGYVVDGVSVTPQAPATVRLDVNVPADAAAMTGTITVTAVGGGGRDILPVSIRVSEQAAGDISLTTSTPALTGSSDASFAFDLEFRNDTAQDVTVSVSAAGDPGWDVTATLTGEDQAASTVVEAGGTQNVTVSVTAPPDAAAGVYPVVVEARAGDRTATADLTIEITGSYSMTLSTPNDLLSASGTAGGATSMTFEIANTGTAPITEVALTATPPSGWEVTFDPPTLPSVDPQATGTITATVTPSSEAVAGDYVISFSAAAAEGGADASAQIRFTVETSPIWALVGLGIIALILGGLFYVFRTYGRR